MSTPRYLVIGESQSSHCCFEATVVDTHEKNPHSGHYRTVCETFDLADAEEVADALNATNKESKP